MLEWGGSVDIMYDVIYSTHRYRTCVGQSSSMIHHNSRFMFRWLLMGASILNSGSVFNMISDTRLRQTQVGYIQFK